MSPDQARTQVRIAAGSRLGYWLLAAALLSLVAPKGAPFVGLLALNAVIAALFLFDRARLLRVQLNLVREAPTRLRAGVDTPYRLLLDSQFSPRLRLRLAEQPCAGFELEPAEHSAVLRVGEQLVLTGQLRAAQHGRGKLTSLVVRSETRLGLCALQQQVPCEHALRAYPDLPLGRRALLTVERRDLGSSPQRMLSSGMGSELDSLREYVASDSLRSIDWKATARRNRPITRAYQPERSQTVWIVVDASRSMTLPVEAQSAAREATTDRPRFVAALEAALELADTALQSGDRVGVLVHAREPLLSVLPGRGHTHFLRIVDALLGVSAQPTELAVDTLIQTLARLAPKRSLLVLFSDLDNEGDLRALLQHARLLSRRHLMVCFSLEARTLQERARQRSENDAQVHEKLAALTLAEQRSRLARLLCEQGMPVLETSPARLAGVALRRYREVKLSGRL